MKIKDIDPERIRDLVLSVTASMEQLAEALRIAGKMLHQTAWAMQEIIKTMDSSEGE